MQDQARTKEILKGIVDKAPRPVFIVSVFGEGSELVPAKVAVTSDMAHHLSHVAITELESKGYTSYQGAQNMRAVFEGEWRKAATLDSFCFSVSGRHALIVCQKATPLG